MDSGGLELEYPGDCSSRNRLGWAEDGCFGLYPPVYRGGEDRDVRGRVCGGGRI